MGARVGRPDPVSVSSCGCIPYRDSFTRDSGFQAELVVPGFAARYDVEDVLACAAPCDILHLAAYDDVWSRGAADIEARLRHEGVEHVRFHTFTGAHEFREPQRELAYRFLSDHLAVSPGRREESTSQP